MSEGGRGRGEGGQMREGRGGGERKADVGEIRAEGGSGRRIYVFKRLHSVLNISIFV